MNNNQTQTNAPFDEDEGNVFFSYNVIADADIPLVYESGDEDDQEYIFTNQMMKMDNFNKKFIQR